MRSSEVIREPLFELIQLFSISFFSSHRSTKDHHVKKKTKTKPDSSENSFSFKKEGTVEKKPKTIRYLGRVCSLLKCSAKLDVIPRGAAPACAASLPPQPGFPSAQGPPPSSGSSSCIQVGAGAATEKPEQLPKLRKLSLPPR